MPPPPTARSRRRRRCRPLRCLGPSRRTWVQEEVLDSPRTPGRACSTHRGLPTTCAPGLLLSPRKSSRAPRQPARLGRGPPTSPSAPSDAAGLPAAALAKAQSPRRRGRGGEKAGTAATRGAEQQVKWWRRGREGPLGGPCRTAVCYFSRCFLVFLAHTLSRRTNLL